MEGVVALFEDATRTMESFETVAFFIQELNSRKMFAWLISSKPFDFCYVIIQILEIWESSSRSLVSYFMMRSGPVKSPHCINALCPTQLSSIWNVKSSIVANTGRSWNEGRATRQRHFWIWQPSNGPISELFL